MQSNVMFAVGDPIERATQMRPARDWERGQTGVAGHQEFGAGDPRVSNPCAAPTYTELGKLPSFESMSGEQVSAWIKTRHRMLVAAEFIGVPISAGQIAELEILARQYRLEHLLRR